MTFCSNHCICQQKIKKRFQNRKSVYQSFGRSTLAIRLLFHLGNKTFGRWQVHLARIYVDDVRSFQSFFINIAYAIPNLLKMIGSNFQRNSQKNLNKSFFTAFHFLCRNISLMKLYHFLSMPLNVLFSVSVSEVELEVCNHSVKKTTRRPLSAGIFSAKNVTHQHRFEPTTSSARQMHYQLRHGD